MIAIVGAGLSGLACAAELQRRGVAYQLFEAESEPGGRVRSLTKDGFTLDRGFQVILSSYDAIAAEVNVPTLQPRFFDSGAILANGTRTRRVGNPLRHTGDLLASLFALPFADSVRFAGIVAETLATSDEDLLRPSRQTRGDVSTADFLASRGVGEEFLCRFIVPFFGGVLLDENLGTSASLFRYYLKKFALGRAWIPAGGMGALPRAMAANLDPGSLHFSTPIRKVEKGPTLVLDNGARVPVSAVVLAVDLAGLPRLIGTDSPPSPRSVTVLYFRSRSPLYSGARLVLPEGRDRLVRHYCQVSNVAPELAPPGWHLVSATVLGAPDAAGLAKRVQDDISSTHPAAADMELLETIVVKNAVPQQPPGFSARGVRCPPGVHLAGDGFGASLQMAITTGREAAKNVSGGLR